MPEYQFIKVTQEEARATLVLNHPPVNVLNITMMEEMIDALREIRANHSVRLLLLRGEGRCFSAGMDVSDHLPGKVEVMLERMKQLMQALGVLDIPTVSAIHGSALGGGLEVALMTDLTYAVAGSKLGQPEIRLGVFPPLAVALYPDLVGTKQAMELILTGRTISSEDALRMGLINDVFPPDNFEGCLDAILTGLLSLSSAALGSLKRAMRMRSQQVFGYLNQAEKFYLEDTMMTEDALEGLQSFLQKRPPQWRHR